MSSDPIVSISSSEQILATGSRRNAPSSGLSPGRLLLLALSVILVAANLRTLFPSISVLLPEIAQDLGLSAAAVSYLTMLPVLCMGLFAPLAAKLSSRIGTDRTLLAALVLLTAAIGLRGYASLPALYLAMLLAGAGIAVANVLLPVIVKRDFSAHLGAMTGFYTMAICAGAAVAAATTLPLSARLPGGWPAALAFWSLPAGLAALVWALQAARRSLIVAAPATPGPGIWRQSLAWHVTCFMGLQSALAFSVLGWLPSILRERGMGGVDAGLVVSMLVLAQIVGCFAAPAIATRCKDQRALNVLLSVLAVAGLLALLFAPLASVWLWALLHGMGQGGLLASALTMVALRSPDARVATQLSAMSQSVGYGIAAFAPWLVGVLRDVTGGFGSTGVLFLAIGAGLAISGWGAGRRAQLARS